MNLPIRTNMGELDPQGKLLGKRELYVYKNGDKYELWIGDDDKDGGTAKQLLVSESYKSQSVNTGTILNVDSGSNNGIVAGLNVVVETISKGGKTVDNVKITPRTTDSDVTLSKVNLEDIQRLVVSSDNYGTDPNKVANPKDGQLFFKI